MIPDYHQFITGVLSNSPATERCNIILHHAFRMFDKKECNETIEADLDYCDAESIGEYFHKQFRQIDMTDSGHLDMIIWNAMQESDKIFDALKFITEHREEFKTKTINRLVDDYDFR